MNLSPLISICIPAYKNEKFLKRLLNSILIQTYKNYEVIVTDDSPDKNLEILCDDFKPLFRITYYHNQLPKGSPSNWNFAISKAKGEWIKMMHNDDWFADANSLQNFGDKTNDKVSFVFSAYNNVFEVEKVQRVVRLNRIDLFILQNSPFNLFKKNFIGHPSTTLIRKSLDFQYDENIKWVVDFEYYIRVLKTVPLVYIENDLINIGIHEDQITKQSFRKPEIEIPENIYLLNKIGHNKLKNIFVYDYYWRLFRNLKIRTIDDLHLYTKLSVSPYLYRMIKIQKIFPSYILKVGIFSKLIMTLSYITIFRKI